MVRWFVEISIEGLQVFLARNTVRDSRLDLAGSAKPEKSILFGEFDSGRIQAESNHLQL
jgi:hypothetical protein